MNKKDEYDQDLEEVDDDVEFEFPPPERKIITQPYDLSVQTLIEQWDTKTLILPIIQREYLWDDGRASRLIESLILNIPIPPLYFAETKDAHFEVIDGHQRVNSIARYIKNEFPLTGLRVLSEYKKLRYHQLPVKEQRFLKTRTLRVVVISHDSHPNMKFEVFERLNTGGIILNAQELRNSLYRGQLNELIKKLIVNPDFRICIGSKTPRKRMVDQELILRFFAMRDNLEKYRPPLKIFLNNYMNENKNPVPTWLETRKTIFEETMSRIAYYLGNQAFRLIDEKGHPLKDKQGKPLPRGVNRALFDAQSLVFSWISSNISSNNVQRSDVLYQIASMLQKEEMLDAARQATGDKARLFLRIRLMAEALNKAGLTVKVPIKLET